MPTSPYLKELRSRIGSSLALLPAVAAVVRDSAGRVLVQRRADTGDEELPAGMIDPGESPAQAVVREVHEETGLLVRPVRLLAVLGGADFRFTYPNGDISEYTVAFFECTAVGGTLTPRDGEAHSARFVIEADATGRAAERLKRLGALNRSDPGAAFEWDECWLDALSNEAT
jgi:8-oxo-dGTP pyrophosphatase MutT (NUDIX family)